MKLPPLISRSRKPRRPHSAWERLTRRVRGLHRLPVNTTGEDDWQVEVPQIRMSRAFAVMLLLHIVAVGGLFAFHIWGRDDESTTTPAPNGSSATADATPASPETTPAPLTGEAPASTVADSTLAANVSAAGAAQAYAIHAGDTKPLIAARFGVAVADIEDANPDKPFAPGVVYTIPRPRRIITATDGNRDVLEPARYSIRPLPGPPHRWPAQCRTSPKFRMPSSRSHPATRTARRCERRSFSRKSEPVPLATPPVKAKPKAKAKPQPAAKPAEPKPIARAAGQRTHVVANGDTVFNVARRYGFTAEEVMKTNGIGNDYRIRLGQVLKIPVKR